MLGRIFWKAVIGLIIIAEAPSLWETFHPFSLPRGGWKSGMFVHELPTFYFGQLVEFSAVYLFGFASYVFLRQEISPEERFLQYMALGNLLLYVVWGNFQSRYILGSLPFFLLLSANFLYRLARRLSASIAMPVDAATASDSPTTCCARTSAPDKIAKM